MAIILEQGTFAMNTSTGNQDVPISADKTQVKAIVFWTVGRTSDGIENEATIGIGWCDSSGTGHFCWAKSEHGQATTNATRRWHSGACIGRIEHGTNGFEFNASAVSSGSWPSGNFRISVDNAPGSASMVHYMLLGGSDFDNISIGNFFIGSGTSTTTINSLGHDIDGLILLSVMSNNASNVNENDAQLSMGFYDGTNQMCTDFNMDDAQATSRDHRAQSNVNILRKMNSAGTQNGDSTVAFVSGGFELTNGDTYSSDALTLYIGMQGPQFNVQSVNTAATASPTDIVSGSVGFSPDALFMMSALHPDADVVNQGDAWFMFGGTDGTNESVAGIFSEDGQSTSDTNKFQNDAALFISCSTGGNINQKIVFKSFDSDTYTLSQTDATNSAINRMFIMAIGAKDVVGGDSVGLINGGLINNNTLISGGGLIN